MQYQRLQCQRDSQTLIASSTANAQPLDPRLRASMESRFHHDFSRVRVHDNEPAAKSLFHAGAYTAGNDIFFAPGRYDPASAAGERLLAHELAHVVQQSRSSATASTGITRSRALEASADRAADAVAAGRDPMIGASAPAGIQLGGDETPSTAPSTAPASAPASAPAACSGAELFTVLDLPWPVPDSYFRNSDYKTDTAWEAELKAAKKGNCTAPGTFKAVKLSWDLGNPKLGRYFGLNINKNDIAFDINTQAVYTGKPCCSCFAGTAKWSFNVDVTRTDPKTGKVLETGKTAAPITGSKSSELCSGKTTCCAIRRTLNVALGLGDSEITGNITGTIDVDGAVYNK